MRLTTRGRRNETYIQDNFLGHKWVRDFWATIIGKSRATEASFPVIAAGALDLTFETHRITTGAGALALTLDDGTDGQHMFLVHEVDGGGDATLTPTNLLAATTITFDDAGDSAHVVFLNDAWCVVGTATATVA